jgi:hypothetical protein
MAQWKSGPFDVVWRDKVEATLRHVRSAADAWALNGRDALSTEAVLAVLLRVLAAKWSVFDRDSDRVEKVRPLRSWLPMVESPDLECLRLTQGRNAAFPIDAALAETRELLGSAADSWAAGDPESPATFTVLSGLLAVLFRRRLVPRPPPRTEP